jgi:ADP-ribosylglycohydrolase
MAEPMQELEAALGAAAIISLRQRNLIVRWPGDVPALAGDLPSQEVLADRIEGALLGAGVGAAFGHRPRTLAVRLAAETWLQHGCAAPRALSDDIVRHGDALWSHGDAIAATIDRRHAGLAWFQAGVGSFGNAALVRAAGVGVATVARPAQVPLLAGLDAVVTHATRRAAAASAVMGTLVAALAGRPDGVTPTEVIRQVIDSIGDPALRASFTDVLAGVGAQPVTDLLHSSGPQLEAIPTLVRTVICLAAFPDDPVAAVSLASAEGNGALVAAVGAAVGAAHGAARLPAAWLTRQREVASLRRLTQLIAARALGERGQQTTWAADNGDDDMSSTGTPRVWFLLDRSGSMSSIAPAVVAGYNEFFTEQQASGGPARATVVQFDAQDPHEVLVDDAAVDGVRRLSRRTFVPRGMTPLYDALGHLLDRAIACGGHPADQMVVIFTDGLENASHTWTREATFARISRMRDEGWTFVFLGANQDSYDTGAGLALPDGSISNYAASPEGVRAAYRGMSRVVRQHQSKTRSQRFADKDNPWGDEKEAEKLL